MADSTAERHLRQGLAARQLGDFSAARLHYLEAARHRPGDTALAVDAAATCLAAQDVTGAAALLKGRRAEGLPDELGARLLFAQGLVLKRMQHPDEASTCFQGSLSRGASTPGLLRQVRREWSDTLLNSLGDPRAAARLYGPAGAELDVIPARSSDARYADDEHAWLTRLVAGLYSGDIECAPLVEGFKAFAAQHLVPLEGLTSLQRTSHQVRPDFGRLRIGFISNQFCSSPVGFLTLATLEALALLADLVFFDRGAKQDWAHWRFRAASREWVDCAALSSAQLTDHLAAADLDAVFDLAGWMDLEVLRALARKPVARQFKWVGGQSLTTGLTVFDGFVADEGQVPVVSEHLYTEPVRRLEGSYITYTSPPYRDLSAQARNPPRVRAVTPGHFALISNPAKIGAPTVTAIRALKPSRLVLVDHRWRFEHPRRLAGLWFENHVGSIDFVTPATHPEYLDALDQLDATVLDTQPYSMGLTAVELRLLGLPIALAKPPSVGTMRQWHARAHAATRRFDHASQQARQLLGWCRGG